MRTLMSPIAGIYLRYHRAYVTIPRAAALCAAFAFCLAVGCTLFRSLLEKGSVAKQCKTQKLDILERRISLLVHMPEFMYEFAFKIKVMACSRHGWDDF